ncbi:MAG: carbon storage regulator CsrA [Chloroflexota bacterium]
MLVLSRKLGESITIGDDIQVFVLDVSCDCVKLGISAPKEIPIYRLEILDEVRSENRRALELTPRLASTLPRLLTKVRLSGMRRRPHPTCKLCGVKSASK